MQVARLWVLVAAICFSTGGTAIKLSEFSGWQISSLRSAIAVLLLSALMPRWRNGWKPACLLVGVAFGATLVLFVLANTLTTATNAIFLQYSALLYMLLLGPRLLGEPNRRSDFLLIAVVATGMGMLFLGQQDGFETAPDPITGNWIGAAAGITWALTLVGLRWLATRPDIEDAAGAAVVSGNAIACLVCLPMALPFEAPTAVDWGVVLYLGAIQITFAYVCLMRGMRELRALEVSLLLLLEPISSGIWALIVHGEVPSAIALAGCALIFSGVVAQVLRDRGS